MLEGDRQAVNQVFGRIAADPQHRRIKLLEVAATDEHRFARWGMAFAAADAPRRELFLRPGTEPNFNTHTMTPPAAFALLSALNSNI